MEIEKDTPNVDGTEKRETTPKRDTNQINTGSGNHNETFKKEVFQTPRGGSTSGSMTANTNNKSKTPRYLCQTRTAKRDSLSETAEKSEGQKFPNRSTGSTSQNFCE